MTVKVITDAMLVEDNGIERRFRALARQDVPEPAVFFAGAMASPARARGLGELFVYNRHDDPDI